MRRAWPDKGVGFVRMNGATDARHMVGWQVPIACAGADHRGIHGADEAACWAYFEEALKIYILALIELEKLDF